MISTMFIHHFQFPAMQVGRCKLTTVSMDENFVCHLGIGSCKKINEHDI